MMEEIPQPTGKGSQPGNNNKNTDQLVTEKNEKSKDTSLKEQPIERTEPTSQKVVQQQHDITRILYTSTIPNK